MEKGAGGGIPSAVLMAIVAIVLLILASPQATDVASPQAPTAEGGLHPGPGMRDCGDVANGGCRDNNTTADEPAADPLAPPAPSNLTWSLRWHGVELRWENPEGAVNASILYYNVYWGVEPDNLSLQGSADPAVSSYYDDAVIIWHFILQEPTTFYYQVTSSNGTGESEPTNRVAVFLNISIEQLNALYVSPPFELTADAGPGLVNLSWSSPYAPGDRTIIGFRVYRSPSEPPIGSTDAGILTHLAEVPAEVQEYTDTRVENRYRYTYYVTAFNAVQESIPSETVDLVLPDVPGHPSDTYAKGRKNHIRVSWSPPNDDGGSPVEAFRLYRAESGGDWVLLAEIPVDTLGLSGTIEYTDKDVKKGKEYTYRVTAVNEVGEGQPGNSYPAETTVPEKEDSLWVCLTFFCVVGIILVVAMAWATSRLRSRDFPDRHVDGPGGRDKGGARTPGARGRKRDPKRVSPDELKPGNP